MRLTGFMLISALAALALPAASVAQAGEVYTVVQQQVVDRKAVFATVESIDVVSARARIGGTIGELRVDEGAAVEAGDILAIVVDDRISPQIGAMNGQVSALESQLAQARIDLTRAQDLFDRGIFPQARLDQANTAVDVLDGQLAAARQNRNVVVQQSRQGDVLAPASGRVLQVPVTSGSVVLPGEAVAVIASDLYLLRLRLPERHARSIHEGDAVMVDVSDLTGDVSPSGYIRQVYPQVEDGRVIADAVVEGLGSYFVGERVRVYVAVDQRAAILVPADYLTTRYGVDYVRLQHGDGSQTDVVVQRGLESAEGVEILGGLAAGDLLVQP
ncbi:efflux RND transporter periplasmic adaptor subunit [uncultured Maricaulis sp.]|uniref:efflux RND transporter periplasmic adaptor subunit n=1 Tax=uncultured Maricaulis sp. TaxID=174710 RepID=UPI0030D9C3DC|tara:strand:+ start:21697 stop:22686 length:990 start_codon:yes stop_codon:yes gene_type:complete